MAKYEVTKSVDVRGEVCPVPDVETKRECQRKEFRKRLKVWDTKFSKSRKLGTASGRYTSR